MREKRSLFLNRALEGVSFLVPWTCSLCGENFFSLEEALGSVCAKCDSEMPYMDWPLCSVCGISLTSETDTCLHCRAYGQALPGIARMRSAFLYHGLSQKAMHLYKDGSTRSLARYWAKRIEPLVGEMCENGWLIATTPGSRKNIARRGYEQVRLIVSNLPKYQRSLLIPNLLVRGRSLSQKQLNRADRAENLVGKITVDGRRTHDLQGVPGMVLIDDICTTGATLSTCARALMNAGVPEVRAVCVCRD